MESAPRRPDKSNSGKKDDPRRSVRVTETEAAQFTQWNAESEPMRERPHLPAQRHETPRYDPTPVGDTRRPTTTSHSSGDLFDHRRKVNYAPYPAETFPISPDPWTSPSVVQARPYSLFQRTETYQPEEGAPIPSQAHDTRLNIHSTEERSKSGEQGSKYYKKTRHGVEVVEEPAITKRRVSVDSTGSARVQPAASHLSDLAQAFVDIPYRDYEACLRFIVKHPAILQENIDDFQHEALRLQCDGKTPRFKSCIQQLLLLRKVSKMANDEPRVFLSKMRNKDPTTLRAFIVEFDKTCAAFKNLAETRQPDLTQNSEIKPENISVNLQTKGPRQVPEGWRHAPEQNRHTSMDGGLSTLMEKLDVTTRHQQDSGRRYGAGSKGPRPPPITNRSSNVRGQPLAPVNEDANQVLSISNQSPPNPPTVIGYDYDIRGDGSEREELDHRYHVRTDGGKFFKIGRVFAMLWHEGAGEPKGGKDHLSNKEDFKAYRACRFGERVHSHILRMAVVKVRHGYCWCIPIHTYNSRGVSKPGFNQEDQEAHAIIHMEDKQPGSIVQGEMSLMTKKAIAVRPAGQDQKLHIMSRLNFGMPYSIQMNVKVMNVGMVTRDSMPAFESYWLNELKST